MDEADAGAGCCGKKPLCEVCLAEEVEDVGVRCEGRLSFRSVSEEVDLEHSAWALRRQHTYNTREINIDS